MTAEYITNCINPSEILNHYTNNKPSKKAGKEIKKAIIKTRTFSKFDLFVDYHVNVYRLKYQNKLYAVVVHSGIEHFFQIQEV